MGKILAKGDPGAVEENLRDDNVLDSTSNAVPAYCKFCKEETNHFAVGIVAHCRKCGYSSPDDESTVLSAQTLDFEMNQHMSSTLPNVSGARTKISLEGKDKKAAEKENEKSIQKKAKVQDEIDDLERKLNRLRQEKIEEQDKDKIKKLEREIEICKKIINKPKITVKYNRIGKYQSRLQSRFEKQRDLNIAHFYNIIDDLENANKIFKKLSLKVIVLSCWEKTLKGNLQRGRSFPANALACIIIMLKITKTRYSLQKDILEKYDPDELENANWALKKKIWTAEKLIYDKILGKKPCWMNKKTGIDARDEKDNLLPDWLRVGCYRAPWKIPITSQEEKIEEVISNLYDQNVFKFPQHQTFETAKTILKDSEKKTIIGGKPKTISAAIIYLALLENKVKIDLLKLLELIGGSESGVKKLSKTINDKLKLGLSI